MRIDVFSIFPQLITDFCAGTLLGKAQKNGIFDLRVHDPREHATGPHRSVDDTPYGGGAGMVLKPEPLFAAVEKNDTPRPLFYLSPSGRPFNQAFAQELAMLPAFSLLCGRYEGVDERVREHLVDDEISLGDYVLAGGEVAALVVIETVLRLVPGVMGNATSATEESFAEGLLEYAHYTKPSEFRGWEVPPVLSSGDHERVRRFRLAQALRRTQQYRPDLLEKRGGLSKEEASALAEFSEGELH